MEIVIVMPYYDRQYQLNKTLKTLAESNHKNFSVVIVDDCSPMDIILPSMPYPIEIIKLKGKQWTNCSPVWNYGFNYALTKEPDAIFLQSAECYHVGDVLAHMEYNLTDKNYLAYGCFQIDHTTTMNPDHDIIKLSSECDYKVTTGNSGWGQTAWWNHSKYSVLPQYWGCAITTKNLVAINGIDERFAEGYAIEDGYFVWQIEKHGLQIEIVDYPFVVHQWHERVYPPNVPALVKKNKALYEDLIKLDTYKSVHTITPDLCGI